MNVLLCNNFVRLGSGVDAVLRMEERCLTERGHTVTVLARDNRVLDHGSLADRLALLASTPYSWSVAAEADRMLRAASIDVVHVHNTVPFLTGSIFDACRRHPHVAVVQSLHNYRALCLGSYEFRAGRECRECSTHSHLHCAFHGCYRGSRAQSAALVLARWIDALRGRPHGVEADALVAVSQAVKRRHVEAGFDAERFYVLPNAIEDLRAGLEKADGAPTRDLVFVGSVMHEKGVFLLCDLAARLREFPFHVIGGGADLEEFRARVRAHALDNVFVHGYRPRDDTRRQWAHAFMTLLPSLWSEPFPMVALESLALGVPVLTSGAGGLAECVEHGKTGMLADFTDADAVAGMVRSLWDDPVAHSRMRDNARAAYESAYTTEIYAERLEVILREVVATKRAAHRR